MAKAVTDQTFEQEVLKSDKPVLVDFWAEWCGPCRQLSPIVDEISNTMGDKLKVVKVNIDESPDAPTKYGVRGIPTLILFEGGKPAAQKVGALPKTALVKWLDEELA